MISQSRIPWFLRMFIALAILLFACAFTNPDQQVLRWTMGIVGVIFGVVWTFDLRRRSSRAV
jgi:hypothetical protein